MGLDDFGGSSDSGSSGGSGNSSSGSGSGSGLGAFSGSSSSTSTGTNYRGTSGDWQTKIDFGAPYVIVARDRSGEVYVHEDIFAVKDSQDSWQRIEDSFTRICPECNYSTSDDERLATHARREHGITNLDDEDTLSNLEREYSREYEVLFREQTRSGWLTFCNLCQKQLDTDPNEVLHDDPTELVRLEDEVYYPPKSKPDTSATCQVCGASGDDNDCSIVQISLANHRKLHVCCTHSVEELAEEGFLQ